MSDLISRQAAIDTLANVAFMHIEADKLGVHESMDGNWFNADEAVEALKQLPSVQLATDTNVGIKLSTNLAEVGTDCISRRAAIDAVEESRRLNHHKDGKEACAHEYEHRHFLKLLMDLPPVQSEIIYCKDCAKHNKGLGNYEVHPDGSSTWIWKDSACPLVSWRGKAQGHEYDYQYCVYAERKETE